MGSMGGNMEGMDGIWYGMDGGIMGWVILKYPLY